MRASVRVHSTVRYPLKDHDRKLKHLSIKNGGRIADLDFQVHCGASRETEKRAHYAF